MVIFDSPQAGGVGAWGAVGPCFSHPGMTREAEDCHGRADRVALFPYTPASAQPRNDRFRLEVGARRLNSVQAYASRRDGFLRTEIASSLRSWQRQGNCWVSGRALYANLRDPGFLHLAAPSPGGFARHRRARRRRTRDAGVVHLRRGPSDADNADLRGLAKPPATPL